MERKMNVDRLSNLPWDVLDSILLRIPLKEAVRTSVLSTKWRLKWTSLSQYLIDDRIFSSGLGLDPIARWDQIAEILRQVEMNHNGPIEKFKLSAYCRLDHSVLLQWIIFLSGRGVNEFLLERFDSPMPFEFPFDQFSCPKLRHLDLFCCIVKLPLVHAFEGFSHLMSLQLTEVSINTETLECLIRKCPVLERLTLLEFGYPVYLKIQNTKLRYLKIVSAIGDIILHDNPFLVSVEIRLRIPPMPNMLEQDNNLVRIFGSLQGIRRLALSDFSILFMSNGIIPEKLPYPLDNLTVLELSEVTVDTLKHAMVCLCLLKSAPNLEELYISVARPFTSGKHVTDFLRDKCRFGMYFNRLKVVKIRGVWEMDHAWHFVKFILANSPVLEALTIVCLRNGRFTEEQLLQLERASERVKILSLTAVV
ncbi:F-box/FBD/LRR-repeat protein At1g13570-like [Humulus lupulus]|uniref:F-box/FBD/LRR-repeat protein At1g13570-like n=1 Tax=Humulus lupulus TaxID=3486 RepID=UPI002B40EF22|nr:F-box/FBD/LRR-repeat protein At1g13570-like [Humulus lupulus]